MTSRTDPATGRTAGPRPAPADAPRPGEGKERILAAALEEFAARGFEGASTTVIARRSGVTQPLIHYHYGSKEGLWRATVDAAFSQLRDEFLATVQRQPAGDPRATVLALTREFVRFCGRNPHFPRLLYTELPVASPRSAWLMDTWVRPVVVQVKAMHEGYARAAGMADVPIGYLMAAMTGASATFFALGDFMKAAYGLDPADPATIDAHADTVVALIDRGLFRGA